MDCKDVLIRLWEYLDEELGLEEAASVMEHLRQCRDCYPAYCWNQALLELLARQRTAFPTPPALMTSLRIRLKSI